MVKGPPKACRGQVHTFLFMPSSAFAPLFMWLAMGLMLSGCVQPEKEILDQRNPPHHPVVNSRQITQPLPPPYSLAILPFEDYSQQAGLAWLRKGLPDMLVTDLALLPGVRVVSRQKLGEVLREQWLQYRGTFEESASVRLGRLVGARYLLSGLYYLGGDELVVEVHLLDVEQGAIVRTFRVNGVPTAIPDLELKLVSNIGQAFEAAEVTDAEGVQASDEFREMVNPPALDPETLRHVSQPLKHFPSGNAKTAPLTSMLKTDTALGLEKLRHVRLSAVQLAEDIWTRALSVRLGSLRYGSGETKRGAPPMLLVHIPLTATINLEILRKLDPRLRMVVAHQERRQPEILLTFQEQDGGANQLFQEAIQRPTRLFVRAVNKSEKVLAVSSDWSWRIDWHIKPQPNGTYTLPSTTLLKGEATFREDMFLGEDSAMVFDTIVTPVPEESKLVFVEIVEPQSEPTLPQLPNKALAEMVQTWLFDQWAPPIEESLPRPGYLPGNRRVGHVVLSGTGGTIEDFQVLNMDSESGFELSIRQILTRLLGKCFMQCENSFPPQSLIPLPFQLRVQFELIKDVSHVGLGSKIVGKPDH